MTMIKTVIPNPAFWKTGRAENTGILRGCNKLPMRAYHSFCDVFQSCRPAALCWLGNQEVCRTTSLSVHRSLSSTSSCSLNEVWRGSDQAAWTILYLWGCDWQLSREVQLPRSLRLSRAQDPVTNTQTNTSSEGGWKCDTKSRLRPSSWKKCSLVSTPYAVRRTPALPRPRLHSLGSGGSTTQHRIQSFVRTLKAEESTSLTSIAYTVFLVLVCD